MNIDDTAFYLCTSAYPDHVQVSLTSERAELYRSWDGIQRVSKIFQLIHSRSFSSQVPSLDDCWILFLGPIEPWRIQLIDGNESEDPTPIDTSRVTAFHTFGLYNIVLITPPDQDLAKSIFNWAVRKRVCVERWRIVESIIRGAPDFCFAGTPDAQRMWWKEDLIYISNKISEHADQALMLQVSEFCALFASAYTRCLKVWPADSKKGTAVLAQMDSAIKFIKTLVADYPARENGHLLFSSHLLAVNAALSRFTSQLLSGISPILSTECHFWCHSLLGVGTAVLAAHNLKHAIEDVFEEYRPYQRFMSYKTMPLNNPAYGNIPSNLSVAKYHWKHKIWKPFYLEQTRLTVDDVKEPLTKHIVYLSGRDNFSQTALSLSFPIHCVEYCNSPDWTLLTMTHELSHTLVNPIIYQLLPNEDEKDAYDLYRGATPSSTVFHTIRKYFLNSIVDLEMLRIENGTGIISNREEEMDQVSTTQSSFVAMCDRWSDFITEVMTHTFDYLCFFQQDEERYLRSIWASWGTHSDVHERIDEYTQRSLAAISAKITSKRLLGRFKSALGAQMKKSYPAVAAAISYVDKNRDEIQTFANRTKPFAMIVKSFLISGVLMARLHEEFLDKYDIGRPLSFSHTPMDMPNKYVEAFHKSSNVRHVRAHESLYLLSKLALDYLPD